MDRRGFITGTLAVSALALAGCAPAKSKVVADVPPTVGAPVVPPLNVDTVRPQFTRVPLPGGPIYRIPGEGNYMAWTLDDGASRGCIEAYLDFAEQTDTRLTFFVTAKYPAWQELAPRMLPLIQTGQIQIANHTMNHASLQSLTDAQIQQDLMAAYQFIVDTFGVDARPFYRPPYGHRDARTDAAAAAIGYIAPTMWYGTLGDAAQKTPAEVLALANEWFLPQHIVIGHVNYVGGVTEVLPQLGQIVTDRNLQTVTLRDVFQV